MFENLFQDELRLVVTGVAEGGKRVLGGEEKKLRGLKGVVREGLREVERVGKVKGLCWMRMGQGGLG